MFLKYLKIKNNIANETIRLVNFKMGANLIVDKSTSSQHNKVGKTTFLRLIDLALGSGHRKYIYKDFETNSTETNLKKFIDENKVSIDLMVTDHFNKPNKKDILSVDLFERGHYRINGEQLKLDEYKTKLNEIFFNNLDYPTFRQLIPSFVRISMKGDNHKFLKYLPFASINVYRLVYNYLFNISDKDNDEKRTKIESEINSLIRAEKKYKQVQNVKDIDSSNQMISFLEDEIKKLKQRLDDMLYTKNFRLNREKINKVRTEYTQINEEIDQLKYQYTINLKNIEDIKKDEVESPINNDLTKDFFNEVNDLIPSVHKTFNELITFNNQLRINKIDYLKSVLDYIKSNIDKLEKKSSDLIGNNETLISLVKDNKIEEYDSLSKELNKYEDQLSGIKATNETLKKYDECIETNRKELDELNLSANNGNYEATFKKFNNLFRNYAKEINNEEPFMTYHSVKQHEKNIFPLDIENLDEGISTGTRKSVIAAYDFAYQTFAHSINKKVPCFIVHDVMESIEKDQLYNIISISERLDSQYIFGILDEKLESFPKNTEDLKILELSSKDKVFRI